jgi:hypothetical protein
LKEEDLKILPPINTFQKDQEPLYKKWFPFYDGLQNKQSYGIFFDNTLELFDFLSQKKEEMSPVFGQRVVG